VRSARITDIDLLAQYGSPAFAFSGAQRKLWPALADAPFIDVSANKVPQDYSRDSAKRAPYNYFFDAKTAMTRVNGVSKPKKWVSHLHRKFPAAEALPSAQNSLGLPPRLHSVTREQGPVRDCAQWREGKY